MPLHLLGKKSWNVYNADNIARVQRDEAAAAAEEHAAEQRMQDADAARRLAVLRGETPPPLPEAEQPADPADKRHTRRDRDGGGSGGPRKRKRAGEDDTEFEMRVARERAEEGARAAGELFGEGGPGKRQKQKGREDDVDIVDSRGHIDLVGRPPPKDADGGRGDGEAERAREIERKMREAADKRTKQHLNGDFAGKPWYADEQRRQAVVKECFSNACTAAAVAVQEREAGREAERGMEAPTTNVWGRDDPKRRQRETARLDANDPLAAMRSGAKKVRDIRKERRKEAEEQLRELEKLRQEELRLEKRKKREEEHADEDKDENDNDDRRLPEPHRSRRSERRHHGDERQEGRRGHVHREERQRRKESERARDREHDRHLGREKERSGKRHESRDRDRSHERGPSSRSHRGKDRGERHDHREKDHDHRDREAKRTK